MDPHTPDKARRRTTEKLFSAPFQAGNTAFAVLVDVNMLVATCRNARNVYPRDASTPERLALGRRLEINVLLCVTAAKHST